jgi:rfaE bifunctional protein nucleotidyltransferase chain/domain
MTNQYDADAAAPDIRNKVVSLDRLGELARNAKAAGKRVVYAHGVFDLLHIGHVRHLETARQQGSYLVVTVTADAYVNKGPGRPVFTERLRAEMLAALSHVDAVAINHEFTAENPLRVIQPDVYVKGKEYEDAASDVTGKIVAERDVVESYGGEVVFTDDVVFSSSNLINRYLDVRDPSLRAFLESMRSGAKLDQFLKQLEMLQSLKVLVIGDAIVDEYQYVEALGRPSKEAIVATQFMEREVFAGGAIAAANHIAAFCGQVELVTALGDHDSYEDLIRQSLKTNVKLTHFVRTNAPTTRKSRFVDLSYAVRKLFEVYFMNDEPLSRAEQEHFNAIIADRLKEYDLVVVTDFGHGLLHDSTVDLLCSAAPFLAVNTQTNSGNFGYNVISKYARANYVCLDVPEARLATRNKYADASDLIRKLPNFIDSSRIIVTLGKEGCITYAAPSDGVGDESIHKVPAFTNTIVDTVGAGDAFFALTAPLVFTGAPMADVGFLGNIAGAMKVGIVGHRSSIERAPYIKFLTALLK